VSNPILGAWIYVDIGNAGTTIAYGQISSVTSSTVVEVSGGFTGGTPSGGDHFWLGPDPTYLTAFSGADKTDVQRFADHFHMSDLFLDGRTSTQRCGGFYGAIGSQGIWEYTHPTVADTKWRDGNPDSVVRISDIAIHAMYREGIVAASGGSYGAGYAHDFQQSTFHNIRMWGVGSSDSHGGCWLGGTDCFATNVDIGSPGDSGANSYGFFIAGANNMLSNCKAWFVKGPGIVCEGVRNHLANCAFQDCNSWGLYSAGSRTQSVGTYIDNCWRSDTTSTNRAGVYIGDGHCYVTGTVLNRDSNGKTTRALHLTSGAGTTFAELIGRRMDGTGESATAVTDSRDAATKATGHVVVSVNTDDTDATGTNVIYATGVGLTDAP